MERREGFGSTGEYQEAVVDWIQAMLSLLSSTGLREFILRDHQKAHLVKPANSVLSTATLGTR